MKTSIDQPSTDIIKIVSVLLGILVILLFTALVGKGQTPNRAPALAAATQTQQSLYREYRGIHLGMTAVEVRAKLGEPSLKSDEQDFYIISTTETAQIAYEAQKVVTISTDYLGGVGAPDYKVVVGEGLLEKPDGSLFRMVVHSPEHLWISYNKSAAVAPTVTITIGTLK